MYMYIYIDIYLYSLYTDIYIYMYIAKQPAGLCSLHLKPRALLSKLRQVTLRRAKKAGKSEPQLHCEDVCTHESPKEPI